MKTVFAFSPWWVFLTGPGVRYVPSEVYRSWFFWLALIVMTVVILIYHNWRRPKGGRGEHF